MAARKRRADHARGRDLLSPLAAEWAGELASLNRSPKTIEGYLVDLRQYLEWLRGRDPLGVTEADVRRYAHEMTRAGLEPRSRARRTTAIREWYGYLVRTKRLADNPAEAIKPPRAKKRPPTFLQPDEVARLRRVIPQTDRGVRDRALIELGLQSLRVSEPLRLNLGDLFLDRRQPMIQITGKGGDVVMQPIRRDAAGALAAWLARRPACESPAVFIPIPPRGPRSRLDYTTVEKALRRYLRAAGIARRIRFHDLRHTLGVHLARRGVPLQHIQDIFRHKNPATTRIYTDVAPEQLADVLEHEGGFPE